MRLIAVVLSAVLAGAVLPAAAVAQHKTVKQCETEWRANKAANQAKGITLKAYVAQCRAAAAAPAAKEAKPKASKKTKASETKTKKQKAPKQTAAPPAPQASPPAAASRAKPKAKPSTTTAVAPSGARQYASEAQAKLRCGANPVVWANLQSKIYHFSGYKAYGATKSGAYMCERDAVAQGMRAAKNEKHP